MEEQKQGGDQNQGQPSVSHETDTGVAEEVTALDYTKIEPDSGKVPFELRLGPYDPRPQEDNARRNIAYSLIGLLWLIVAGMLILLAFGSISVADLKDFGVIVGPIVTLVSAATGFYYGTKSNSA